ncbi:MAG: C39 family peptidase [Verrucomicrobiota bacterium]
MRLSWLIVTILSLGTLVSDGETLEADLSFLTDLPAAWEVTPETLEEAFPKGGWNRNPYFSWLTTDRTRAHFFRHKAPDLEIDLTILGGEISIEEAIVDFADGKFLGASYSIWNRADSRGEFDVETYDQNYRIAGTALSKALEVRPFPRKPNSAQGLLTTGWTWISAQGMAVLESNEEAAPDYRGGRTFEFLRLRMMRRDARGALAASMQSRSGAAVKLSDLPRNVTTDKEGNTYIANIPMVDQGPKGYCVVASTQRLFEYYGIPADQHQIAQIAESNAEQGTNSAAMAQCLQKIDYRFKTRFKALGVLSTRGSLHEMDKNGRLTEKTMDERDFVKTVQKSIDDGIPLLWALTLGRYPEEPPISPQTSGGHMRMIIGYNDTSGKIVFSDSWGAGHEKKFMDASHGFQATHGLFSMTPTVR